MTTKKIDELMKVKSKAYNLWKIKFDKEYNLFKEYIVKKVQFMTNQEFEKFKNCQIKLAKKMKVFE